jgi:hypothetical protein
MGYIHDQIMKADNKWRQKSLEELENQDWGDPTTAPTNLVKRCIELSKVPIDRFTISDLRLMIGQQFGLPFLIPIALEKLHDDIFVEADFYEGDLLTNVLNVEITFWSSSKNYWTQLNNLISEKRQQLVDMKISATKFDSVKL